ncbi:MAG: PilN domain-containing protein [Thermoanaerobaculia bacterium]
MVRINLLPEGRKPGRARRGPAGPGPGRAADAARTWFTGPILLALVAFAACWLLYYQTSRRLDREIGERQQRLDAMASVLRQVERTEGRSEELRRRIRVIHELKANQRGPVEVMDQVSRALPELLWLTRLQMASNVVSIQGEAFNTNAVASFLENLEQVPGFRQPVLRATEHRDPIYTFDLTFQYVPTTEGSTAGGGAADDGEEAT